jgi:hypothetical protein
VVFLLLWLRKIHGAQIWGPSIRASTASPKEYTAWQRPFSGVHSIMMEKLAQAVEGGGARPPPFHYIYNHVQSCSVRSSWEGRARICKRIRSPGIDSAKLFSLAGNYVKKSCRTLPPGWESIPGLLKRFTNTGSDTLAQFLLYPYKYSVASPTDSPPPTTYSRGCCCRMLIGRNCHMINDLGTRLRILPSIYNCRSSRCRWDFRNEIQWHLGMDRICCTSFQKNLEASKAAENLNNVAHLCDCNWAPGLPVGGVRDLSR